MVRGTGSGEGWGSGEPPQYTKVHNLALPFMQQRRGDPDLAGVRAKDALARLPDEERERWERLWFDVDALLRLESVPE